MNTAAEVIQQAIDRFGSKIALSTSFQKGGMIVLDLAIRIQPSLRILTIDTGRLPEETFSMIESVRARYGVKIEMIYPDAGETSRMAELMGPNLFLNDYSSRMLCCQIRKVRPLSKRTAGLDAIFTGLRRDQSETREAVEQIDESGDLVKVNPLAHWSKEEIDRYTVLHELPVHPLYAKGYTSIGCHPCTRPTTAGENERAGRWWWETQGARECGIHFGPDGRTQRKVDVMLTEIVLDR